MRTTAAPYEQSRHGWQARQRCLAAVSSALVVIVMLGGCSWFGGDKATSEQLSVFDLKVGDCTITPQDVTIEITSLDRVACDVAHQQEVFAVTPYIEAGSAEPPEEFPGADALTAFADGTCAEAFLTYVGVDYRDSRLYYTYLLPSARGWEQNGDRQITCFVTTTGDVLEQSVKNTQW